MKGQAKVIMTIGSCFNSIDFSAWISHLESSVYITLSLNQGLKWRRKEKTYSDKSTQKQKEASQIDYSTRETIFY